MNKLTLEAMQNILSEVKKGDLERVAFKSERLDGGSDEAGNPENTK